MLVLLPPSESKQAPARGAPLRLDRLSLPQLTDTRAAVLDALVAASARPDALAQLRVPPTLGAEVARNTVLRDAATAPAGRLYSGVLYAALDLPSLDAPSRRRAARRLLVASALFGAVRITDRIPAYRLAMDVDLDPIGPLARVWRTPLSATLPALAGRGLVVDTRSAPYAAAWSPSGQLAQRWVHVRVPGASHGAKHTRGLVARALCQLPQDPSRPEALPELLDGRPCAGGRLEVHLADPATATRPWTLEVTVRPTLAGARSG